jgi:dihydrofolate reductase
MSRAIFYAAVSLDGYIAGPNSDMSWAEKYLATDQDYGYAQLVGQCSAALVGRKTFEYELQVAPDMERILPTYVVTEQPLRFDGAALRGVHFVSGDLRELMAMIRERHPGDLFIAGGAELVDGLMVMGLLDEMRLFVVPEILGAGVRLFKGSSIHSNLTLISSKSYDSGLVELRYNLENPDRN